MIYENEDDLGYFKHDPNGGDLDMWELIEYAAINAHLGNHVAAEDFRNRAGYGKCGG